MDRNHDDMLRYRDAEQSLSARRAWIEIAGAGIVGNTDAVALRKESVDRNNHHLAVDLVESSSLSARRAWIEMRIMPIS